MNAGWVAAAALLGCILSAGAGYTVGRMDATTALLGEQASEKVVDLGKVIEKQVEFRKEEVRRGDVVESVSREADSRVVDTAASSAGSDVVAQRLQRELEAAERRISSSLATCDARIAEQGKAAAEEYRLLANLYRESDAAAGIRAKEAEDYRIAGEACEAIYDGVRNSPR